MKKQHKMSSLEMQFSLLLKSLNLPEPVSEYRVDPARRWRFDFAWPNEMIAVELEGGVWSGGRHTRGAGYTADLEKYNRATILGWRVFRFTRDMLNNKYMHDFLALWE